MVSTSLGDDGWAPWPLEGAFSLTARAADGASYRLGLSVPPGEPPSPGFPLLIVLDGDALFATASAMERRLSRRPAATGVQPTVILGIGHENGGSSGGDPRRRDFTHGPCTLPGEPAVEGPVGGGTAFHDFICDIALPLASRATRIDPANVGLFGHSMAGLFVLETLARHPSSYRAFIAASPSLWWSADETLARLASLPEGSAEAVLILAGALETPASERQHRRAMVDTAMRAGETLAASSAVRRGQSVVVPDADHGSIVDPGLRGALQMLGNNPRP